MKKDYTNQTLIKGSFAFNCLLLINQILSVQIEEFSLFYFYKRKHKLIHYLSSMVILLLLMMLNNSAKAQVAGKVFKDFNANATQEVTAVFTEPGIAGVTVTAYNAADASVGTATTAADGSYTIAGASGALRIEFSNFPVGIYEGAAGSGNNTSVQFVTAPINTASLGINCPEDYCNTANPKLVTVCYDNGSGVGNTNPVVVDLNYTDTGTGLNAYPTNGTADNMGTVWGVAYDKKTKLSYFSAFLKRQAGLGDRGLDGIYVINYATATPTLVGGFDLEGVVPSNGGGAISFGSVTRNLIASGTGTGTNDLSADRTKASRDADAYGKVGKVGYGDIDIDQNKNTLWAVNLNERSLVAIDISSNIHGATIPTTAAAAKVKRFFIDGATAPFISGMATCPNGTIRPFGLKIYKDKGYLGTVCDGSSLTTVDLSVSQKAYVYSFDLANPTAFTEVTSVPLNYNREQSWVPFAPTTTFDALESDQWQRWIDTYTDPTTFGGTVNSTNADFKTGINGNFVGAPQPILSDIEILPNGDMVLGFMDRFAHQQGWLNLIPASTTVLRSAVSHGDILLASKTSTGFVFEGPNENDNFTTPAVSAAAQSGQELNDGPSGAGEFFYTDYFIGSDATHPETALGGLAILPGSNEITAISFDPVAFNSMGVRWMNHNTGVQTRNYTIVSNTGISNFGKGSGLGDVELLCNLAPIEIGNRVWKDSDSDGIQDAGEFPLVGVRVVLYNSSNVAVDTATTDANGNYYFSSSTDPDVKPNTSYQIKVVSLGTNASVTGLGLADITKALGETSGQNTGSTLANNDAFLSSNIPTILFTTGDWGENNHSLDVGFTCKPKITATPKKQIICGTGTASAFTRKVITGFVSSQQWYGPLADTTSAFGTAIAGAVDSTYTPTTLPAAGQTKYYAVVARNGDALCADTAFVALSVPPKIVLKATPSNALCNAGGGSITTTVTGGTTPYTYLWSNAATTPSITAVAIGSYKVSVTDAAGCTADTTLVLTQPDSISLSLNAMNVSCNAGTNGALMSIVSGGKAGYTYEWNGITAIGLFFSNDPTVANLLAGTYSLKVTDANGCTKTKNIVLTQPVAINIAQTAKSNICFDQSKGEIYVAAGGGVSPYTITWKVNGVVNPAFNGKDTLRNLVAGIYELTLKDANGCSIVEADTIKQPAKLVINYTKINGVCANGNKGSINSIVTGGVAPYAYAWSNGVSVANVANLVSGNYKLVVTDAKNCKDSITVFVDEQDCRVDVALKKTVDGLCERKVGDLVTFNVTVSRKDTTSQTTKVIVKDQIAAEFLVTSTTATKGTFDGSTGLWSGINLAKGDSAVLTVKATIKATAIGLLCNQAYVDFMDKIDIDSQAGNLNPVEDDIAYACVSVPINLCQADGNSATLTTPDSLANIKWFKNGTELTAEAGKSTITVKTAGSYTYTGTSNGTLCQVGNCCPVIIKDACYGSIGDYVWNDNNINGKQDEGEIPVAGVKVYLLDGTTGAKLDSTITDINGNYLFDSLLTSTYKVQFVEPVGKDFTTFNIGGDTTKDSDAGVNGISSLITIDTRKPSTDILRNNPTIDAGIIPQFGSIGDYVWTDKNNDGQQTVGENPIAGVKVYLYDATGISLVVLDSTVTDANGKYLFDSLLAGTYKVQFVAPTGTLLVSKAQGGDSTKDSNPNPATGITDAVVIDTTQPLGSVARDNMTVDAGIKDQLQYGSIGDLVWIDQNGNGQQDGTEAKMAGIKIYLYDGTGTTKLDSTVSDANGKYLFDSLITGSYKVKFVVPAGLILTKQYIGNEVSDSDANNLGFSQVINIDTSLPGTDTLRNNPQIDVGFIPVGSLGDYVFIDKNGNGTQEATDTPIAGIKVYLLDGTTGAKLDSTLTDANGKYLFDSLLAGTYKVKFVIPAGSEATTKTAGADMAKDSNINPDGTTDAVIIDTTLPVGNIGRDNPTIDAGIKPAYGSIGDYVWSDKNNDGQQTVGELPIAGVKVYLYNAAGTVKLDSTVTDANGKYLFDSLLTGSYKVKFVAPAGTIASKQNVGADVTDSDANKLGFSQVVNINTALLGTDTLRNNPQIDAGFVPVGSLGDFVWFDTNKDGLQTLGEPAVKGVKVYLLDGVTGVKLDSTVTNALGKYLFDSLLSGSYKVQFVAPKDTNFTVKGATPTSGLDSNPNATTGVTDAVTIDASYPLGNAARDNRSVDAGLTINLGSIAGKTFDDNDKSGTQNTGDVDHAGVKVYLYKEVSGVYVKVDSVIMDSQGNYTFNNLTTANYQVQFNKPTGTTFTASNVGNDTLDSDASLTDGKTGIISINTNLPETDLGRNSKYNDAGFIPVPVECKTDICIPFIFKKVLK